METGIFQVLRIRHLL
ncbi:hypothetical protein QUC31_003178 [Theobroma cacao]